ncbi:MAG TPA: STAS domain-containing protein [Caulobacteraceae bacterium]|jgi:anti-anti-sigma factor
MDIQFTEVSSVKKVVLTGRLDTAGVDLVEAKFDAGVVAGGRHTIVDLTQVEFMGSLGVRMIIRAGRSLASNGGRLVLFGAREPVLEVIELTGLHEIVPSVASESEALERVAV